MKKTGISPLSLNRDTAANLTPLNVKGPIKQGEKMITSSGWSACTDCDETFYC